MFSYRLFSHPKTSRTNNKRDIGTLKFGTNQLSRVLWQSVDDLERRASRSNVCMLIEGIYMCQISAFYNLPGKSFAVKSDLLKVKQSK